MVVKNHMDVLTNLLQMWMKSALQCLYQPNWSIYKNL